MPEISIVLNTHIIPLDHILRNINVRCIAMLPMAFSVPTLSFEMLLGLFWYTCSFRNPQSTKKIWSYKMLEYRQQ